MSEKEAIFLAQQGDEQAFLFVYKMYTPKLYGFIMSRVNNLQDAEDLTAVVWEKIIQNLKKYEHQFENSFSVWVFRIARNTLFNFYKSNAHQKLSRLHDAEQIKDNRVKFMDYFDYKRVYFLVNQLPPQQSEVIKLKYFSDLKNNEIARYLDISEKTVASNLSRAIKKLSRLMQ